MYIELDESPEMFFSALHLNLLCIRFVRLVDDGLGVDLTRESMVTIVHGSWDDLYVSCGVHISLCLLRMFENRTRTIEQVSLIQSTAWRSSSYIDSRCLSPATQQFFHTNGSRRY